MITFITGATGKGKTAFATHLLEKMYFEEGQQIWRRSCNLIENANIKYGRHYTLPDKVPFYTNYKVTLHIGYKRYYETYFENGYYFGVANDKIDTQFVALGGTVVFDESQRIFNSRKSATFEDFVSYAFEIHRQARLKIFLLAQRGKLLDCNIRELGVHVIEIVEINDEKDIAGNTIRTTWKCLEFDNWRDAQPYFETGVVGNHKETTYVHEGNIFESFDSFEKEKEFLPPEGKDFDYLPHKKPENVTERQEQFYKSGEPKGFRSAPTGAGKKQKEKEAA